MNRASKQQSVLVLNIVLCLLVIAYSIYSLICYGLDGGTHSFGGIPRMQPSFADLRLLTHASGCEATVQELLSNIINCDPFSRSFNYPPIVLLLLRMFRINAESTALIGVLQGVLAISGVSVAFLRLSNLRLNTKISLLTICISSFPFQLALERGNYDLWVLLLLLPLSLLVDIPTHSLLKKTGIATLSFWLAALKIFPLIGIGCWYIWQQKTHFIKHGYLWIVCPAVVGVALQAPYLGAIFGNTPKPKGDLGFGLRAVYQGSSMFTIALVLKILTLLVCFVLLTQLLTKYQFLYLTQFQQNSIFSLALWMIIPVYLLSLSFDYRLLFLLFAFPFIVKITALEVNRKKYQFVFSWFIRLSIVFVAYEQYLSGALGTIAHLLSDAIVQPALFMGLIGVLVCTQPHDAISHTVN